MIKYLIMDVDGTLTDGKIYIGNDGECLKAFSAKDGYGIHNIALASGILPVIITGRESKIVLNRCEELGINEVYQGVENKIEKLLSITLDLTSVAYIGDDLNDLECMEKIKDSGGLIGCPKDAAQEVKKIADFVSEHNGGNGAVRDFIEWIVETI